MKSKFAKFVDRTLGAALVFFAATALLRYYTTLDYAMFSAATVTACVLLVMRFVGKRKDSEQKLSAAAENMFYDFMFLNDSAPTKLLAKGLCAHGLSAKTHGSGVYSGKTAAFCAFDGNITQRSTARLVAKAKHYGADKIILLTKSPQPTGIDVDGFTVRCVSGNDVYSLFASLGALPARKFNKRKRSRFAAFRHALDKDKILRYLLLSAMLFTVTALTRFSLVTFVCACACAALFLASCIFTIAKKLKSERAATAESPDDPSNA